MVAIKEWYGRVNAVWPAKVPPLTFEAGANAVSRLHRFVGASFSGNVVETSGNRSNYPSHEGFRVNTSPARHHLAAHGHAWGCLIHDLSHYFVHWKGVLGPGIKPHSREHARLELRLVKEVVKRGWLTETQKEKPVVQQRDERLTKALRIEAAIQKWESKLKRAQNALKKLNRKQAYYKKHLSAPSATVH